jgi:hypothetical protein
VTVGSLPAIGTRQVSTVTPADVRRLHRSLHDTPYVANRVVARLATFFSHAISEGVIASKDNPTHGVLKSLSPLFALDCHPSNDPHEPDE